MPELPEIEVLCKSINRSLRGIPVESVIVKQPKCTNLTQREWNRLLKGASILKSYPHGKWAINPTDNEHLLLFNLGMGCGLLLVPQEKLEEKKYQFAFLFENGKALRFSFWWFGNVHLVHERKFEGYALTSKLGPHAYGKEFTLQRFKDLLQGRKGAIKQFLLNQKNVAGIGNAYIHDILFLAKLHPFRTISTLTKREIEALHKAIVDIFSKSVKLGGAFWEYNIYGRKGRYDAGCLLIGYREGKPCPACATSVEKMKTGSTTGFICPRCQKLK
ncbi:MAG: Fpg/Nei family DNA glycosylase [Candidatus Zixiibacteriota bacterium]